MMDVRDQVENFLRSAFGTNRAGDTLTLIEKTSYKLDQNRNRFLITETNIQYQRRQYSSKEIKKEIIEGWKVALVSITGMEIRKFNVGIEDLHALALGGPKAGQIIKGKSLLLVADLFHRQEI